MKELLEKPYKLYKKLQYLKMELDHYEKMMFSVKTVQYDFERVDKSPSNKSINQYALEKYDEIDQEIKKVEMEYDSERKEIEKKINQIEKEEYKILLKMRYLEYLKATEICDKLFISYATYKRWLNECISILNNK